jgi:hypothetical protein
VSVYIVNTFEVIYIAEQDTKWVSRPLKNNQFSLDAQFNVTPVANRGQWVKRDCFL